MRAICLKFLCTGSLTQLFPLRRVNLRQAGPSLSGSSPSRRRGRRPGTQRQLSLPLIRRGTLQVRQDARDDLGIFVNNHLDVPPSIPYGGTKQSGYGMEMERQGLEEFTQMRIVNIAKWARQPSIFPKKQPDGNPPGNWL